MTSPDPGTLWKQGLDRLSQVSERNRKTWLEPIVARALTQDGDRVVLEVGVPSDLHRSWVASHFAADLQAGLQAVAGHPVRLAYVVDPALQQAPAPTTRRAASAPTTASPAPSTPPAPREGDGGAPQPTGAVPLASALVRRLPGRAYGPRRRRRAAAPTIPTSPATQGRLPFPTFQAGLSSPGTHRPTDPTGSPDPSPVAPGETYRQVATPLNPHYVFDTYVEGESNRLARSAAAAVAERPGATAFNPFVVYGGVGLGKTHLIQAIGAEVAATQPDLRVLYTTSEVFTSQFVAAIQANELTAFTQSYRQVDVLIVDDIQFLGGKEKTQEEFFHLFNTLHQAGRQIILSADRAPREIAGIEERLLSRFSWGLTTDVREPDFEMRRTLLARKAETLGASLSGEVLDFVAAHLQANVRELEGALVRLVAYAGVTNGRALSVQDVKHQLRDMLGETATTLTVGVIQEFTARETNVPVDALCGRSRKRVVVQARHLAMYLARTHTAHSLATIGRCFGGRDHSTVLHACRSIEDRRDVEPTFRDELAALERRLKAL